MVVIALFLAAVLAADPLANPDVLEESVLNEVCHAIDRGEAAVGRRSVAAAESVTNLVAGLDRTAAAIRLVSVQRPDGTWRIGTNDVTAAALVILRDLAGVAAPPPVPAVPAVKTP